MLKKKASTKKIKIFIAGDSTACNYRYEGENNEYPRTGWGQVFGDLFLSDIEVINCARSGRSSKSFLTEDCYTYIKDNIGEGDYLFIQFAHNDGKKEDPLRFTSPEDGTYQECIYKFINTARDAGAYPILCTSITRNIDEDTTLEPYGNALREIAKKEDLPLLEIYNETHKILLDEGTKTHGLWHMILAPKDGRFIDDPEFEKSQYYDKETIDNTHLNCYGAREVASIVASELKRIHHPLTEYLA